ncbi:CTP synthase [Ohessyouella blattaphilus]|uniref:CTP synthase n=1 Tax=Ohessyouella blattaphilus TaxID=2949333 RepID=A0ABT1EDF5_9FIRM|nr:CTP synthase [Ohessyouella blattaphilus]MCP1108725.1 CTP synthase [Ohessyouella blattaphilus]MCR8562119.1 CTP synthase [Ohessyouella blattaphilus]MDL2249373.1 CTP synthase [Lachnospiraceae bacterium OttesenSCG-928-J05]
MSVKYVFVTGGVVSGLGKGITAASLGRLLKARGYTVTMQKFDPYINIDPGTMNPVQHGEVFVTNDGAETDLDLGHYERFIDENLSKNSNVTTGKIYWSVLQKERRGDFGGGTVQVIPHITNEIKDRFYRNPATKDTEIAIIEVGGTVGDMESQPFLESIRQFQHEKGRENVALIHVTLIPYLRASQEMKTKPTQASVKDLQELGLQPDVIVCRSEYPVDRELRDKISLFCNVPTSHVLQNLDVEYLYEAPLAMEEENLAGVICECLKLDNPTPDLKEWKEMVEYLKHPTTEVTIALVGKYIQLHDAYISVVEALKHGGIFTRSTVNIKWIDSEEVTADNVDELLGDVNGILVPGGFGDRGIDGKIHAITYARENKVPYLGLCLGMQLAIVEFARNVIGYHDAHSAELKPDTTHPMIHIMPEQIGIENIGGTLRLGAYPCILDESSKAYGLYGQKEISERHRHRYEVNNDYREELEEKGMLLSGFSPDGRIVEMIELKDHPWFLATQAHPELKSRPNRPHPLFQGFVEAALKNKK